MRPDFVEEADRWRRQATEDLGAGEKLAALNIHYAACFFAQQAAEKALKALVFESGREPDRSHSVIALSRSLVAALPEMAADLAPLSFLDQYYIPTRYPDAIPSGIPADAFGSSDSTRAVEAARACLAVRLPPAKADKSPSS